MIVTTQTELDALREIGRICAEALKIMAEALEPGLTTRELDAIGADYLQRHGAKSAPITCYDFPGCNCISVNDVVAHGIPGDTVLKAGDVINIDVSAVKDGFFSDNGASFALPPVKKNIQELLDVTKSARNKAIAQAVAGHKLNEIGRAADKEARRHGLTTIKNLCGHGVGHTLHDDPDAIFSYYERRDRRVLQPGLVIAIEPFICHGDEYVEDFGHDGWTLKTPRRLIVAQYEHTVMVRENQPPLILTALE